MGVQNVSRETTEMLHHYEALLERWTRKINLIAPSTIDDIWTRHIEDCACAVQHVQNPSGHWVDVGSGGGLPGLVSAILYRAYPVKWTLVESDKRKCAFLRTVVRELALNVHIAAERFEEISLVPPDILSARALADLNKLLDMTSAYHHSGCTFLFMKGRAWREELQVAEQRFQFSLEVHPSVTDTDSATLLISNVQRLRHDP